MMTDPTSRIRLMAGVVLIAGTVALAGCGSTPESQTFTTRQTTTTLPVAENATTTTITTAQADPLQTKPDPPAHRHYARRHRPVKHDNDVVTSGSTTTDTETIVTPPTPTTTTTVTRKLTETTNAR